MNTKRTFLPFIALMLAVGLSACTADKVEPSDEAVGTGEGIIIEAAHFRPMDVGQATTVGTFTVTAERADRLVGVSSPQYRVELHRYDYQAGMTQMVMADGLALPAGETVQLTPKGYHLLLIEPGSPLSEGERVTLILDFEYAADRTLYVPVTAERPLTRQERMNRPLD